MRANLYAFMAVMWTLMLLGGGIAVTILGPITVTGYGEMGGLITSAIKAIVAVALVIVWVFVLARLKDWIFRKAVRP